MPNSTAEPAIRSIFRELARDHEVWGPETGADGVIRLRPLCNPPGTGFPGLPVVPLKKLLLPAVETLWSENPAQADDREPPRAVIGVAPCDLAAVAYLDRVFAEDAAYGRRRSRLLLVGQECRPGDDCFCPDPAAISFDLFLHDGAPYAGSPRGAELLARAGLASAPRAALPAGWLPRPRDPFPEDLFRRFAAGGEDPAWQAGERCLSCGACSVVCPTCYCYDVRDEIDPQGRAGRLRSWDNCFFREHALVAGGHSFRPGRSERLRFRFEHKLLGLGALRGVRGCVGCGRCRRACPVDIDLAEVARRLGGGGGP